MSKEKIDLIKEVYNQVLDLLSEERNACDKALMAYEPQVIQDADPELRRMRDVEAIKLRHESHILMRLESVIKRMVPRG